MVMSDSNTSHTRQFWVEGQDFLYIPPNTSLRGMELKIVVLATYLGEYGEYAT
jgi:hypothetical protein